MVCRFVASALGQPEAAVSPGQASELVYAPAAELGLDARHLDVNIWNYQRSQGQSKLGGGARGLRPPFGAVMLPPSRLTLLSPHVVHICVSSVFD